MNLYLDLETRSSADLEDVGAWVYAQHADTEILTIGWAIDQGPAEVWDIASGAPLPAGLLAAWLCPWGKITSYGSFDRILLEHHGERLGLPLVSDHRWHDLTDRVRSAGGPGSLKAAGLWFEVPQEQRKLADSGEKLLAIFSKPQKGGQWVGPAERPEQWRQLLEYNRRDVIATQALHRRVPYLVEHERAFAAAVWRMNERGLPFDKPAAVAVARRFEQLKAAAATVARTIAPGVNLAAPGQVKVWLGQELGKPIGSLTEADDWLADPDLPAHVGTLLRLRSVVTSKAASKAGKILSMGQDDPQAAGILRARSQFVFCGAADTGRLSGRGIQPQNFKRPAKAHTAEACEQYLGALVAGNLGLPQTPQDLLAEIDLMGSGMRALVTHPSGIVFSDFSAIELRVIAAVAAACLRLHGGTLGDAADITAALRAGIDLYKALGAEAAARLGVGGVTAANAGPLGWRDVGKTLLLGLGYQLGPARLVAQITLPGRRVSFDDARALVELYRSTYAQVPLLWKWLQQAFAQVAVHGGRVQLPGIFSYHRDGSGHVVMTRASGASIVYRNPEVVTEQGSYGPRQVIRVDALNKAGACMREAIHGGMLTAHLVQSTARDLMAHALVQADAAGLAVVGSVHDEILVLGGQAQAQELHRIMLTVPPWAAEWAIAAETQARSRWGK